MTALVIVRDPNCLLHATYHAQGEKKSKSAKKKEIKKRDKTYL
jgi:hypothetical protein